LNDVCELGVESTSEVCRQRTRELEATVLAAREIVLVGSARAHMEADRLQPVVLRNGKANR